MRKKILIMAYAISPYRGSEYSLSWNFTTRMATHHDVVVLYGTSGDYFGDATDLVTYLEQNEFANLKFKLIEPSAVVKALNFLNKLGFGPAFYVAFKFWHRDAYAVAQSLCHDEDFDLVHQLGPIGFREPGYLWKLGLPFVWGPIGGAQFINTELLKGLPVFASLIFRLKNIANYLQLRFSRRVRQAANTAVKLVFATEENRANFGRFFDKNGPVISELACGSDNVTSVAAKAEETSIEDQASVLKMVWCGHISARKNLYFLLFALSRVEHRSKWVLTVIGEGKIRKKLERLAKHLGIDQNITWAGGHNRRDAVNLIKGNDLHVMCSLSEANTAVFYEATDLGIPTLALDRDGMSTELSHGNGLLVEISDYESTLDGYAGKVDELIRNPQNLKQMREKTVSMLDKFSWDQKIEKFRAIYESAITARVRKIV